MNTISLSQSFTRSLEKPHSLRQEKALYIRIPKFLEESYKESVIYHLIVLLRAPVN